MRRIKLRFPHKLQKSTAVNLALLLSATGLVFVFATQGQKAESLYQIETVDANHCSCPGGESCAHDGGKICGGNNECESENCLDGTCRECPREEPPYGYPAPYGSPYPYPNPYPYPSPTPPDSPLDEEDSAAAVLCNIVPSVSAGQKVTKGQQVGRLKAYRDTFGPHLHFELKAYGNWILGDGKGETWLNQQAALGCPVGGTPIGLLTGGGPTTSGGQQQAGKCSLGIGLCSPASLSNTFPNQPQTDYASIVCNGEGGNNAQALNDSCLCGTTQESRVQVYDCSKGPTGDYSVGPFQINLLARCPEAFEKIGSLQCQIINDAALEACKTKFGYGNPDVNEAAAFEISKGGTDWGAWTAAEGCPVPQSG